MAAAVLIAFPGVRPVGLVFRAAIVTVVRHRELSRFAPLGAIVVLLGLAAT